MKNKYLMLAICIGIMNLSQKIIAQTTTIIDYNPTPASSIFCDVFQNSPSIGGYIHNTTLGQPFYSASQSAIGLSCNVNASIVNFSTSFKIAYPFKGGYNYKIKVNAYYISNNSSQPTLRVEINNSTAIGGSSCNGPQQASFNVVIPNGQDLQITNTSTFPYQDYDYNSIPTLTTAQSFLNITAYNLSTFQTLKSVYIKKITITETPPATNFTLSPNSLTLQKGISTTQNFTIINGNNSPNVTGYIWNIGATPNGWLYNGTPAPSTINTTVNTLSLTSVACANTVSNISASATIGTTNNQTNSCTVTVNPITYSITANSNICPSSTSTVSVNAPVGASVSWSLTNAPIGVSITPNSNPATITIPSIVQPANMTLNVSVASPCGDIINAQPVNIFVGPPSFGVTYKDGITPDKPVAIYTQNPNNLNGVCLGSYGSNVYIDAFPLGASSVTWQVLNDEIPQRFRINQQIGNRLYFYWEYPSLTSPTGFLQASITNSCGSFSQIYAFNLVNCGPPNGGDPCALGKGTNYYTVSPNPAKEFITIGVGNRNAPPPICNSLRALTTSYGVIFSKINIYNRLGTLVKSYRTSNSKQASIQIGDLVAGSYVVEIIQDDYSERQQIIIQ